jgi:hypothetical protein
VWNLDFLPALSIWLAGITWQTVIFFFQWRAPDCWPPGQRKTCRIQTRHQRQWWTIR